MTQANHSSAKKVRLFRKNRSQAIRIPAEFELPGDRALIGREGDRLIIEPVRSCTGLLDLLATWPPQDEESPEVEDKPVKADEFF